MEEMTPSIHFGGGRSAFDTIQNQELLEMLHRSCDLYQHL